MAEKKFQGGPFSGAASASQIEGWIKLNQILSAQLKEVKARSAFLTGVQKTWIATYLHGATGDEPYTGRIGESNNYGVIMCPRWRDVLKAIEDPEQELSQDFDARALLEWADGKRLTLTAAGLAAWERLNTTKQANTQEAKAADTGLGLAAAIGARACRDIRLVVRTNGVTFHGTKSHRPYSWDKIEFGGNATEQKAFLITIAAAGGFLAHPGHEQEVKRISTSDIDGRKLEGQERKREIDRRILQQYYHNYADEKARNRIYAMTTRLNKKFMALFPEFTGKPFENKNRITYCYLKEIKFQQ